MEKENQIFLDGNIAMWSDLGKKPRPIKFPKKLYSKQLPMEEKSVKLSVGEVEQQ